MSLAVHKNEKFWLLHVENNAGLLLLFRPHLGSKYSVLMAINCNCTPMDTSGCPPPIPLAALHRYMDTYGCSPSAHPPLTHGYLWCTGFDADKMHVNVKNGLLGWWLGDYFNHSLMVYKLYNYCIVYFVLHGSLYPHIGSLCKLF